MKEEKKHEERMTDKIKNNYLLFIKKCDYYCTQLHNSEFISYKNEK